MEVVISIDVMIGEIITEIITEKKKNNRREQNNNPELLQFLRTLTPGTCIVIQYDSQRPTSATFQGFQGNNVIILSDFDCFPGLARIAINKINVISINSPDCDRFCCKRRSIVKNMTNMSMIIEMIFKNE